MTDALVEAEARRDLRLLLGSGEEVLWAIRRRGPGPRVRRYLIVQAAIIGTLLALATAYGGVAGFVILGLLFLPPTIFMAVGQWFVTYGLTDRRFIVLCRLWPRSWGFSDLSAVDPNWITFNRGRDVIDLWAFQTVGFWNWWERGRVLGRVENVPDIEGLRALVLKRISLAPPPPPTRKPRSPRIPGTRTG
jgi:hypothetical protein